MTDTSPSPVSDRDDRFRLPEREWDRVAAWAITLGAVLRVLWILVIHSPVNYVYSDMQGYVVRAWQLAGGAPLTPGDGFFPPGTHMLLSIRIEQDGPGLAVRLGRNVLDMTATTMPWPQDEAQDSSRAVVQVANVLYSVLLPWIVIESVSVASRRRKAGTQRGEVFMVLNLACLAVVAILVIGDPRVRSDYDVFGFALLGALLADRFRLDASPELGLGEVHGG